MKPNELFKLLKDYSNNKNLFVTEALRIDKNGKRSDYEAAWDMYNATSQSKTSTTTGNLGLDKEANKKFDLMDFSRRLLTASSESKMPYIDDVTALNDAFDLLVDKNGKIVDAQQFGANIMKGAFDQIVLYTQQQTSLLNTINEGTSLTGQYSKDFRSTLTDANPRLEQLGISFEDLATAGKNLVLDSGKFAIINQQTWERAGVVAKAYVGTLADLVAMYPAFAQIGLGASDAADRIEQAGQKSLELGLEAKKVTTEVSKNLGRLNEFGFKNGVDGLTRMVQRATELRMNLDKVFELADKVMEPEGAIDLSANLMALGGAVGSLNDPMKMMYMATNNVEGFTEAISGAAVSLATYNEEQGRFEVTGVNLRRAKEMADKLGMSMGDLNKVAIATAERTKVSTDLMARGLQIDDKQKEFITNIAQMKGGKMVVELGSSPELRKVFEKPEIAIEELTQNQLDTLLKYQNEFKKATPEELIRNQATSVQNISRDTRFMVAMIRKTGGKTADEIFKAVTEEFGYKEGDLAKASLELTKKVGQYVEGGETKIMENFRKLYKEVTEDNKKQQTTGANNPTNNTTTQVTPTNVTAAKPTTVVPNTPQNTTQPLPMTSVSPIDVNATTTKAKDYMNYVPDFNPFLSRFEKYFENNKNAEGKNSNVTLFFKAQDGFMDPVMRNFRDNPEISKLFLEKNDYLNYRQ